MKLEMRQLGFFPMIFLVACGPDETISGQVDPADVFALTRFNGKSVGEEITITFPEEGKIAGQAPCNSYFAAQKAPLPWFEAGPIAATRRACPALELETQYFDALGQMTLVERTGDVLILSTEGADSLEFRRKTK